MNASVISIVMGSLIASMAAAAPAPQPIPVDPKAPATPAAASPAPSDPQAAKPAPWKQPSFESVKSRTLDWLKQTKADPAARAKTESLWAKVPPQADGSSLLEAVVKTFALGDPRATPLIELCGHLQRPLSLKPQPWLTDPKTPRWESDNLRLYYGRWLTRMVLFDEAMEQLGSIGPADVAAPADLLFYQAANQYRALNAEKGIKLLDQLLDGPEATPRRYLVMARLLQADLRGLQPDTLDHIARRMGDIGDRLNIGRAGPRVRGIEEGVVKSLDKIIKKLEDEQNDQDQDQSSSSQKQPTQAAKASKFMAGKGHGDVNSKKLSDKGSWGNLPPKEREEAMQQIGRDFPAHYRDVIEQYMRKLAAEEGKEHK